jgi:hypothetical protein
MMTFKPGDIVEHMHGIGIVVSVSDDNEYTVRLNWISCKSQTAFFKDSVSHSDADYYAFAGGLRKLTEIPNEEKDDAV